MADTFERICQPNSLARDAMFRAEYESRLPAYDVPLKNEPFEINNISKVINSIKAGKSPGFDGLTIEHFLFAHPVVVLYLKYLFDIILFSGNVPSDFGKGITVPIPKEKNKINNLTKDDFRPITINPITSKIFECCLLNEIGDYLITDSRQFGFKKGIGCSKAIYAVRHTVDFFTKNDSTVNLGCLDLSKAFDKVNHYGLMLKLMNRSIPTPIINILINWFSKSSFQVLWKCVLSSRRVLNCGLRQGGVLSPLLFSVFVDDLLKSLEASNYGCFIKYSCVNSFMYADDIILISISIYDMQRLVNLCVECLDILDLPINLSKCNFVRIGPRFKMKCCNIRYGNVDLSWVDNVRYLGVFINCGKRFSCSFSNARKKFFRAFNAIYGRVGGLKTCSLLVSLLATNCTPILLYGTEATDVEKSELRHLCHTYDRAFMKIFGSFDRQVIVQCQWFSGCLDFAHCFDLQRIKFLFNMLNKHCFNFCEPHIELSKLLLKYDISLTDSEVTVKAKVTEHFRCIALI